LTTDPIDVVNRTISQVVGRLLRQLRESRGLTRPELAWRLPSRITEHTLLTYEHGIRHLTFVRLVELCSALGAPAPEVVQATLQQAGVDLELLSIRVNLRAVIGDENIEYESVQRWAANRLAEDPEGSGIVRLTPDTVREMAAIVGCPHQALVSYLARFTPDLETTRGAPP
jgi:transcriptional regulator with XRE-family HTH domain